REIVALLVVFDRRGVGHTAAQEPDFAALLDVRGYAVRASRCVHVMHGADRTGAVGAGLEVGRRVDVGDPDEPFVVADRLERNADLRPAETGRERGGLM